MQTLKSTLTQTLSVNKPYTQAKHLSLKAKRTYLQKDKLALKGNKPKEIFLRVYSHQAKRAAKAKGIKEQKKS